jgi:hypothetical protein
MQLAQLFISNKHGAKEMCYAFFPPPPVLIIQPPGLDFFLVSLVFFSSSSRRPLSVGEEMLAIYNLFKDD